MARGKRKAKQREGDLAQIARYHLMGWAQEQIADKLDLTQQTVSNDIKELLGRWRERAIDDVEQLKHRELARLDQLESEAWDAWGKSRGTRTSSTVRQRINNDGTKRPVEVTQSSSESAGDAQYLRVIQYCVQQRAKILGIDAPQRHEVNVPGLTLTADRLAQAAQRARDWEAENFGDLDGDTE